MRIRWWRSPKKDPEIEAVKKQVARTGEMIAEQRERVDKVVQEQRNNLMANHLAERVRAAFREYPR
jgi:Fe2+ or Zn2+ uptake regulation protein